MGKILITEVELKRHRVLSDIQERRFPLMYNNILVAFDGSEFSRAALVESSNWIKRHGGRIIMVHAVYFDEEEFTIAPEQREKRFEIGKNICYQTRENVSTEFNIKVES